jgi:cytochrome b561
MNKTLQYGTTAKILHWLIVALLVVQYSIGWLMPDIHGTMLPGTATVTHISIGITILVLIVLRLLWRLTHPVAPESSLPRWQRVSSEFVHWLLYVAVLATTLSGWIFASFRGWSIRYFFSVPLPMLASKSEAGVRFFDGRHQAMEWTLLVLIGIHVAAAIAHIFYYRDRIMQRMLWP